MKHKLIIEIGKIPFGSKVTKKNGEKVYRVGDRFTIYGPTKKDVMIAPDGFLLLIDPNGNGNIVENTLEVVWLVYTDELESYLTNC
jgi:hypothetical protein